MTHAAFEYRYEQRTFKFTESDEACHMRAKYVEWYNAFGADGWEMFSVTHTGVSGDWLSTVVTLLLKRQIDA